MTSLVGLLEDAWADLDRLIGPLTVDELVCPGPQGRSIASIALDLASTVDAWLNVPFARRAPHALVRSGRLGGAGLPAREAWSQAATAITEVRSRALSYLALASRAEMDRPVESCCPVPELGFEPLTLGYALLRVVTAHYFHMGEISAALAATGRSTVVVPGPLAAAARAEED